MHFIQPELPVKAKKKGKWGKIKVKRREIEGAVVLTLLKISKKKWKRIADG